MASVEHASAIRDLAPKTLIDVGANKGQFSLMARYLFPGMDIQAFEPLESERRLYRSVVTEPFTLHPTALGATAGEATFFIATRADSSSLLKPGSGQASAYGVTSERAITVPVRRLAELIDVAALAKPILMKLDVQGGEMEVLRGGESILPQIDAIYCEVSFVHLYEGQPLASEIVTYLATQGFELRGVFNLSFTSKFGPTQADFLFRRSGGFE